MATVTLNYDARNRNAVNYLKLMISLNLAKIIDATKSTTQPFDTVGLREYRAGNYTIINNGKRK